MLSTLKNLDNRLGRCVGAVQATDGKLGTKSQTSSRPLVGMMNTPLRTGITRYVQRGEDGSSFVEFQKTGTEENNEQLKRGLLAHTIFAFHDPNEICSFTQDTITEPTVYVGAQDPRYYRAYNGPMYRRYLNGLISNGRQPIDPETRICLTDYRNAYNPDHYRPSYPEGTTFIPHMNAPTPYYYQPVSQPDQPVIRTADHIIVLNRVETTVIRLIYPRYTDDNIGIRFNASIETRVGYAIKHFLTSDEPRETDIESNSVHAECLMKGINLRDLHTVFRFGEETAPNEVDPVQFRGIAGFEDDGIIFIRERPYSHMFQNGRGVLLEEMYIEFFVHVLQAYFYTGLTQRRPTVFHDYARGVYTLFIPYAVNNSGVEIKLAIFEVSLKDYMNNSQRWILKMVSRPENIGTHEVVMDIRSPEFNEQGNAITYIQAAGIIEERRIEAESAATSIGAATRASHISRTTSAASSAADNGI
jgi:hypothetical protein